MKMMHSKDGEVPGNLEQTAIITKYAFLDYFRSRRFFILLVITIAIGAILTGVVAYFRPQSFLSSELSFYSSWWGQTATFVIILSAVFFGGDAISGEFQNNTGYFTVNNPIRRSSIYTGKFLAAFLGSLIMLLIFTTMTIGNGAYYFGSVPSLFLESLGLSILYLAAALGLTFFFSSLFKSNSMSILVTVILFLFVFSLVQGLVSDLAHVEPWFLVTYGSQVIGNIMTSPYPAHVLTKTQSFGGHSISITTFNATLPEGIIIMVVYFVVTAVAGLVLFERKEFT